MTKGDDGWPAEVPEKKADKGLGALSPNKFLIDLVSGGAVAAIAKTAFSGGNLASVARFAPTLGLNIALKEQYRNYKDVQSIEKNEPFSEFLEVNALAGSVAGASTFCIVYPIEKAFTRTKVHNPRLRANKKSLADILKISPKEFDGLSLRFSGAVLYNTFYFGLYDSLKVQIASGDEKLNFFSAWALALGTTSLSYPFYFLGQLHIPEHRDKVKVVDIKGTPTLSRIVYSFFHFSLKALPSYMLLRVKEEGWKRLTIRSATGGLVLAGYDEIQKWLH